VLLSLLSHSVVEEELAGRWMALRGFGAVDCVRVYLTVTRQWKYFGAKLFPAKIKQEANGLQRVWLAVNEEGVTVLNYKTLVAMQVFPYSAVITFGGYQQDFIIVISCRSSRQNGRRREGKSQRPLFVMSKYLIAEITMLMVSYINSRSDQQMK